MDGRAGTARCVVARPHAQSPASSQPIGVLRRAASAGSGEGRPGLRRYMERDFSRYLECGDFAHGSAWVRCESCKDELLVIFSCKGRGNCPSCNAKQTHVTAAHLVERVLPHVVLSAVDAVLSAPGVVGC